MNAILFLAAFVAVSLLGALILWLKDRSPQSMEAHMKAFERELEALSPESPITLPPRPRRSPPPRPASRTRPRPAPRTSSPRPAPRAHPRGHRSG